MEKLEELLEKLKGKKMSAEELEEQRRSFAFGNTATDNVRMTRRTVNLVAERSSRRNITS